MNSAFGIDHGEVSKAKDPFARAIKVGRAKGAVRRLGYKIQDAPGNAKAWASRKSLAGTTKKKTDKNGMVL